MHSVDIFGGSGRLFMVPVLSMYKILDGVARLNYNAVMEKFIRKVSKKAGSFKVNIPMKLIMSNRWGDVGYVLIEAAGHDKIIIRRFVDGKSLKG